ncbi:7-carboxy-7-deazaguanine synthase QueE [Gammaproteobacteria bacterium AB-CW1]|uniref:7-carboxy-7-deazaguanine synthase n=2 Tax=Natronospiraceae TaxID=3151664 RepID=A0AAP6JCE1_9GAMM|nr:7-carboxy-7-deazaguanine synthase QueE [Gammaproteobacteria bacterium AB-CW1]
MSSRDSAGSRVNRVRITEIFHSLQGESRTVGLPTVFVRLTGCPLRCVYCDTEYAFHGGEWREIDDICREVASYQARHVTVTGGEPLAQFNADRLIHALADGGQEVSVETSGAMDISVLDDRIVRVMDIKTPGSGEVDRNRWENLDQLRPTDQLKFVICNRADYEWSRDLLRRESLQDRCEVLFSPEHQGLKPAQLAEWILEDRLPVRFQLQLHKYLWGDVPGR